MKYILTVAALLLPSMLIAQIQSGPAMIKEGEHTFMFNQGSPVTLSSTTFGTGTSFPANWSTELGWTISTSNKSNHTGASGGSNAAGSNSGVTNSIATLTLSNLSTVGFDNVTVIWAGRRSTQFEYTEVKLQWSTDGTTWEPPVAYTQVEGNLEWALVNNGNPIALPAGAANQENLRIRLSYTVAGGDNTGIYRVDDFVVKATPRVSWSVDLHLRPELSTGSFSTVAQPELAAFGDTASFMLYHGENCETKYTIKAQRGDGPIYAQTVQVFPPGVRTSFMFESAGNPTVPVYIIVPDSLNTATTKAISIHHGTDRDGDAYCDHWKEYANENNTIAFAPTFSKANWLKRAYHHGNIMTTAQDDMLPEAQWSFTVVENIMHKILTDFGLAATQVDIWGHSAGGQFVHRMAFFKSSAPVRYWMAANPGVWLLADANVIWPYGFGKPDTMHPDSMNYTQSDITAWTNRRVVVFRGTSDVHEDDALADDDNPEGYNIKLNQGVVRMARADTAFSRVNTHNSNHNWSLHEVPFVGHSGRHMARYAAAFLKANPWNQGTARNLTVSKSGKGYIYYPDDQQTFTEGAEVTLRVVPEEGFAFSGWTGGLSGTDNPATVVIDGNKSVTATFTATTRRVIYSTAFDRTEGLPANWSTETTPSGKGGGWTITTSKQSHTYSGVSHATGASAYRNIFITSGNAEGESRTHRLRLSNIDTRNYTDIRISWGARRTTSKKAALHWSINDGATWNSISWVDVDKDVGYKRIEDIQLPAGANGAPNLSLRWTWSQSGSNAGVDYRMDDIIVTGVRNATQSVLMNESFNSGMPSGWQVSGTGWAVNATSPSDYSGASAGMNLRASNSGVPEAATMITSAPIDTTNYQQLTMTWGARRSSSFYNPIILEWSIDNSNWHYIHYNQRPNDGIWGRMNDEVELELPVEAWGASALRLRWSYNRANNDGNYRIDDVRVYGTTM